MAAFCPALSFCSLGDFVLVARLRPGRGSSPAQWRGQAQIAVQAGEEGQDAAALTRGQFLPQQAAQQARKQARLAAEQPDLLLRPAYGRPGMRARACRVRGRNEGT